MNDNTLTDMRFWRKWQAWSRYVAEVNEIHDTMGGSRSGYVYVMQMEGPQQDEHATLYKIGRSKHPEQRLKEISSFKVVMPMTIRIVNACWADDMYEAERYLHAAFAQYRTHGEWFLIPNRVAATLYALWYFENGYFADLHEEEIDVAALVRSQSETNETDD